LQQHQRALLGARAFECRAQQRFDQTRGHDVAGKRIGNPQHGLNVEFLQTARARRAAIGLEIVRIVGLQLTHLARRAPALPRAARVVQIRLRGHLFFARGMKARRQFGGQCFDLCEAVTARVRYGLRIPLPSFVREANRAQVFGAHQFTPRNEIHRACASPHIELIHMALKRGLLCGIARG
jgi:hypothetical protein